MTEVHLDQPASFAELEQREQVVGTEIIASLTDYAEQGAAINGDVVVSLIERAGPAEEELKAIREAAIRGIEVQATGPMGCSAVTQKREQAEYAQVLGFASLRLEELSEPDQEQVRPGLLSTATFASGFASLVTGGGGVGWAVAEAIDKPIEPTPNIDKITIASTVVMLAGAALMGLAKIIEDRRVKRLNPPAEKPAVLGTN